MDIVIKKRNILKSITLATFCLSFAWTPGLQANDLDLVLTKAKNLSLQRDRLQATKVLRDYLEKEGLKSENRLKAIKMLKKVSEIFYEAKSLQAFELGKAKETISLAEAAKGFEEVQSMEALNTRPMEELARIRLLQGECDASLSWANRALKENPYKESLVYLKAFALGCSGEPEQLLAFMQKDSLIKEDDLFRLSLGQAYMVDGSYDEAKLWFAKIEDQELPDKYYFLGVMYRGQGADEYLKYFAKYVDLCNRKLKKQSEQQQRDPRSCKETDSVKEKYKLLSGTSIQKVVK